VSTPLGAGTRPAGADHRIRSACAAGRRLVAANIPIAMARNSVRLSVCDMALRYRSPAEGTLNSTVKRGGPGGDYFLCQGGAWLHVVPTFDPNSADGYGPNQPLPPLCVRFPDPYTYGPVVVDPHQLGGTAPECSSGGCTTSAPDSEGEVRQQAWAGCRSHCYGPGGTVLVDGTPPIFGRHAQERETRSRIACGLR
jgi:hypothetical protein